LIPTSACAHSSRTAGQFRSENFAAGALNNEMGMSVDDADLDAAALGQRVVTPSGMVLDGSQDAIEAPPGPTPYDIAQPQSTALLDYLEFLPAQLFPGGLLSTDHADPERKSHTCRDRMHGVSQAEPSRFGTTGAWPMFKPSTIRHAVFSTGCLRPRPHRSKPSTTATRRPLKQPIGGQFVVSNIYTDLKRHDLGPNFHERNYDGTTRTQFMTPPLWGVGALRPTAMTAAASI